MMKTKIIFMLVAIFAMYSQSRFFTRKKASGQRKNSSYAMQPSGESPTA